MMCLRHAVLEQRVITIFLNQIMPVRFMITNTTLMVMSTANFCLVINYVDNAEFLFKTLCPCFETLAVHIVTFLFKTFLFFGFSTSVH